MGFLESRPEEQFDFRHPCRDPWVEPFIDSEQFDADDLLDCRHRQQIGIRYLVADKELAIGQPNILKVVEVFDQSSLLLCNQLLVVDLHCKNHEEQHAGAHEEVVVMPLQILVDFHKRPHVARVPALGNDFSPSEIVKDRDTLGQLEAIVTNDRQFLKAIYVPREALR